MNDFTVSYGVCAPEVDKDWIIKHLINEISELNKKLKSRCQHSLLKAHPLDPENQKYFCEHCDYFE